MARIWRFLIDTIKDGYAVEKGRKQEIMSSSNGGEEEIM
jgi:hypothetical protein